MPIDAILYDGLTAHRQPVKVEPLAASIELTYEDGFFEEVDAGLLIRLERDPESLRLGRTDLTGWRLILPVAAEDELRPLLHKEERYGRWIDRLGLGPALIALGVTAAAVVAIGYLAPQWIAPHVPESWERNVGTAIVGDFGDNRCRRPAGQRALDALVERLEPGATAGPRRISAAALDVPVFNAAALPGGHIIVFDGALQDIENPDALAGIIAHEIAHVRRRHVTEALIRELGIGALIRLFAGDIGANAQQLVALSYTRDNEREADSDAIIMLRRAGISPAATGDLFERLSSEAGEDSMLNAEFLNSHPLSRGRAQRFRSAVVAGASYRPSMSAADFAALKAACGGPKDM